MSYNYMVNHIPKSTQRNRRPMLTMNATTITIHNTGNTNSTAQNERAWLTNPDNDRQASYHIVVDEKEVIECLPLNENAWHAGDGSGVKSGNRTSIGIEICESGNYNKTLENAAHLVAKMLKERGWGTDRLKRHYDWSGKICPRLMYSSGNWTGWYEFIQLVTTEMKSTVTEDLPMTTIEREALEALNKRVNELESKHKMKVPQWAKIAVEAAVKAKLIDTPDNGSEDFYRLLTVMYRKGLIE